MFGDRWESVAVDTIWTRRDLDHGKIQVRDWRFIYEFGSGDLDGGGIEYIEV